MYSPLNNIHVLNGDSLKEQFPSEIKGEIIVARECMVDGSVQGNTSDEIFKSRAKFINETFDDAEVDYYAKTVSEFEKIKSNASHSEINLWFEDDLFCQVNFWFVIHYILEHKIEAPLYLIRPITSHQYGFGGMNQLELQDAYKNKIRINDVIEIGELWKFFQKENISEMIQLSEKLQERYPFILPAVKALQESFEFERPKKSIKSIITELDTKEFGPVFREFCKREAIYGFGDVQVKRLFDEIIQELEN
ncbi:MAG: DUF1835 domain-containing protein [Flavobacteriaceae bacterium]|nr:DUF1835 domain-containing protein [Flavobacteriaceae bacterium]